MRGPVVSRSLRAVLRRDPLETCDTCGGNANVATVAGPTRVYGSITCAVKDLPLTRLPAGTTRDAARTAGDAALIADDWVLAGGGR